MELKAINKLKLLLKASEMADVTDFISDDETDFYIEELEFELKDIEEIQKLYNGWGNDYIKNKIEEILKDNL